MSAAPTTDAQPNRLRTMRNWTLIILTNLVSLVCMYYALRRADIGLIWGEVRDMSWTWVALAVVADIFVYALQSWRWILILKPVESIALWTSIRAIYVGMFANEVLPLRTGELIRCFLITRWSSVPLSVSFASALIERIFDGIWLMACFFVTLHIAELPKALERGGYLLGIFIIIAAGLIALGMFVKNQSFKSLPFTFPKWFNTVIEDLNLIGHSRYLYYAFLVSGVFMLLQIVPIYGLIQAYGLDLETTIVPAFTVMVLLRLSSVVPQGPGNVGLFQIVASQTLAMFGVSAALSKRFSLVLWAVVTLPLIVAGFTMLVASGAKIANLHREAQSAAQNHRQ